MLSLSKAFLNDKSHPKWLNSKRREDKEAFLALIGESP